MSRCTNFRRGTEPEVYFRIIYVTPVSSSDSTAKIEQSVEIALGPKGAFENGNIGTITRRIRSDQLVSAVPPRIRNRKPPKAPKTPRVKELLQKALEWQMLLKTGEVVSQAEIASRENLTRARVTQVMKLLRLAPEIQDYILSMPDIVRQSIITEHAFRPIASMQERCEQIEAFNILIGKE